MVSVVPTVEDSDTCYDGAGNDGGWRRGVHDESIMGMVVKISEKMSIQTSHKSIFSRSMLQTFHTKSTS